ncbi:nucleotidyl transferase AbiEii/AbiGii toxin family protein [soil metagenome]
MLQYHTIDKPTLELLKQLQQTALFKELRLVGGTSLALQIGHRTSIDIDLFGSIEADELEINRALAGIGSLTQLKSSTNIHIYLLNNVKVAIVNYPYPWLSAPIQEDDLLLAGITDIAAMKIAAITGRGSKKDFIDLYFILQQMPLEKITEYYTAKFKDGSLFMALKSIVYFDDADQDEMPNMFAPVNWEKIKRSVTSAYQDYIQRS